jgi:hypothetical protein
MKRTACGFLALVLMAVASVDSVRPDGTDDEAAPNPDRLAKVRSDPELYARVLHDVQDFLALPPDRQQRLRQLDRDLHQEKPETAARLHRVLERYADWREHLPASDRLLVESADSATERLKRIRAIRERQWIARLPRPYRDQLEHADGEQRTNLIRKLRQEQEQRRRDWQLIERRWDDFVKDPMYTRLADYHPALEAFVTEQLLPRLTRAERDRLQAAEGHWPLHPRTLVELTDKYPIALPGPATGPSRREDLPPELQKMVDQLRSSYRANLKLSEGKWPDYAMRVTEQARRQQVVLSRELGPTRPQDFSPTVRRFIHQTLEKVLDEEEKKRLKSAERHWPIYPLTVLKLARDHQLQVPDMTLPGPAEYWDKYRLKPLGGGDAKAK